MNNTKGAPFDWPPIRYGLIFVLNTLMGGLYKGQSK